jgi:hypothetical protein
MMNTFRAATRRKQRDNRDFFPPGKLGNLRTLFAPRQGSDAVSQAPVWVPISDQNGRGESSPNESAVILDFDPADGYALVDALKDAKIEATAFQAKPKFLEYVARQPVNFAILVLHSKSWWKDEARLFCNSIRYLKETPWGAPRIHGELKMLGFDVSERTVLRWMRKAPRNPEPAKRWAAFLSNHREAISALRRTL